MKTRYWIAGIILLVMTGCATKDMKRDIAPVDKIVYGKLAHGKQDGYPITVQVNHVILLDGDKVIGGHTKGMMGWKVTGGTFDGKTLSFITENSVYKRHTVVEVASDTVTTLAVTDLKTGKPITISKDNVWPRLDASAE